MFQTGKLLFYKSFCEVKWLYIFHFIPVWTPRRTLLTTLTIFRLTYLHNSHAYLIPKMPFENQPRPTFFLRTARTAWISYLLPGAYIECWKHSKIYPDLQSGQVTCSFAVTWLEPRLVPMFSSESLMNTCCFCSYLQSSVPNHVTQLNETSCDAIQIKTLLTFLANKYGKICLLTKNDSVGHQVWFNRTPVVVDNWGDTLNCLTSVVLCYLCYSKSRDQKWGFQGNNHRN